MAEIGEYVGMITLEKRHFVAMASVRRTEPGTIIGKVMPGVPPCVRLTR